MGWSELAFAVSVSPGHAASVTRRRGYPDRLSATLEPPAATADADDVVRVLVKSAIANNDAKTLLSALDQAFGKTAETVRTGPLDPFADFDPDRLLELGAIDQADEHEQPA
jgi:hypothetical protein